MTILIEKRPISLTGAEPIFRSADVSLNPRASAITLRLKRPTSADPVNWATSGRLSTRIILTKDGEEISCAGGASGGIRSDASGEVSHYELRLSPTRSRLGVRDGPVRRLGETAKSSYTVRVEVERLAGTIETEIELTLQEATGTGDIQVAALPGAPAEGVTVLVS